MDMQAFSDSLTSERMGIHATSPLGKWSIGTENGAASRFGEFADGVTMIVPLVEFMNRDILSALDVERPPLSVKEGDKRRPMSRVAA